MQEIKKNNFHIQYYSTFFTNEYAQYLFDLFEENMVYNSSEQSKIKIHGRELEIPRKQVAYGETGTFYRFSGKKLLAIDWNDDSLISNELRKIIKMIENKTGTKFNFILINRYNDGNQYIGYHNDDTRDLVPKSDIVGISIGTERDMLFKSSEITNKLKLNNGSMYVIKYPTNNYYKHSIPKRTKVVGPRISLTFRLMK